MNFEIDPPDEPCPDCGSVHHRSCWSVLKTVGDLPYTLDVILSDGTKRQCTDYDEWCRITGTPQSGT
jgi:hypothetical protein